MKPGMAWPIGVAVILGATVVANIWVMRVANSDPAFAVEPDYYKKAVNFDSTMAQERANLTLGWGVATSIAPIADGKATRLTVTVRDAQAAPLTGARIAVMTRFNARANDTLTAVLTEETPGVYAGALSIAHVGEWEVRVDASRNGVKYSASSRVNAVHAVASTPAAKPAAAKSSGALQ
jgi:nitrogen fixation protein FixH